MKIVLTGIIIMLIISVVLYFFLMYLHNVLSHQENKIKILGKARKSKQQQELMLIELITRRRILENEINNKAKLYEKYDDVRRLTKELEEVNNLIDEIKNGGNI